jgi:acyl-coenzyme A thioesterase PaaI-like protein
MDRQPAPLGPTGPRLPPSALRDRIEADRYGRWLGIELAARVGSRLVGEARETRQGRRAGFYAMTVTDEADGTVVATCQAVSLRSGSHQPR